MKKDLKTKPDFDDLDYSSYLQLDKLLNAQDCISAQTNDDNRPAHDELLFITVHQAYELWFKQILFEIGSIQELFSQEDGIVKDSSLRRIIARFKRVTEILKLITGQLDILETMTPLDFLDFRHVFRSASGFQSIQFRTLEIKLGLRKDDRVMYDNKSYETYLSEENQATLAGYEQESSLFNQMDDWLSRTPFVNMDGYDFWAEYEKAVSDMIETDKTSIMNNKALNDDARDLELKKVKRTEGMFVSLFDEKNTDNTLMTRLSHPAMKAALFINLYRDKPALQAPSTILSQIMDIEELLTLWRYRHCLMVQRMLGIKMGSGGSSGHEYLVKTAAKHAIFNDLFSLSSFFIPRSKLPELPSHINEQLCFAYELK